MSKPRSTHNMQSKLSTPKLAVAGVLVFLVVVIATAPAMFVAALISKNQNTVRISSATGTIWRGSFEGAYYDEIALGKIDFAVRPLSLLLGRASLHVSSDGGIADGGGDIEYGVGGRLAIRDAKGRIKLSHIRRYYLFGGPITGEARFDIESLVFEKAGCRHSEGIVSTNVLSGPAQRINGSTLDLSGALRCEGDNLLADLTGANDQLALQVQIIIQPDLRYDMVVTAEASIADIQKALLAAGFEENGGALVYNAVGVLNGAGS